MAALDRRSLTVHTSRIRRIALLLATSLGMILLAGCSDDRLTGGSDAGAVVPENGRPDKDSAAQDESVSGSGGGLPENAPPGGGTLTEQIVRTGDLSVEVDDITSAANRITAMVDAAGGSVGSDQRYGDADDGTADLVVRVPPDRFDELIETIGGLGEELSRSVAAEDVSTVVADVDARVTSLQNSVDRLLALAAQAVSVSDLIMIEAELSARQSELESLQAQQRALSDQVSLATLSVRLTASTEPGSEETGFLDSIAEGWNALLDTGRGLISFIGLLIPWLALLAVIVLPLWFLLRRRRTPAVTGPPATVSGPAANEPARPPE
ncbi:hypothetical protein BH24ACT9_BH24ACT9_09640 [soil metagenome]